MLLLKGKLCENCTRHPNAAQFDQFANQRKFICYYGFSNLWYICQVLFKDAAINLLNNKLQFNQFRDAFKIASNMVESFEFYDLTPILIEEKK